MTDSQFIKIAIKLFSIIGVNTNKSRIKDFLLKHPDYPNIKSFTSLLSKFQVKSKIGKINSEKLIKLNPFFLAQILNEGFVIISSINSSMIKYYSSINGWVTESFEDFNKKWNGIVILLNYKENENKIKLINENTLKYFRYSLLLILFFSFFLLNSGKFQDYSIFFFTKLLGFLMLSLIHI